jgi:hypothetical protein
MVRPNALAIVIAFFAFPLRADSTFTMASADMYGYQPPHYHSVRTEPAKEIAPTASRQIAMVQKQPPLGDEMIRFFYRGQETIPVTLSRAADIVLQLFDKDGQFVSVIYNGRVSAGRNEIPIVWAKLWRGKYSVRVKENRY